MCLTIPARNTTASFLKSRKQAATVKVVQKTQFKYKFQVSNIYEHVYMLTMIRFYSLFCLLVIHSLKTPLRAVSKVVLAILLVHCGRDMCLSRLAWNSTGW